MQPYWLEQNFWGWFVFVCLPTNVSIPNMDLQEERKNDANKYHAVLEILVCLVFLLLFIFNFHDIV